MSVYKIIIIIIAVFATSIEVNAAAPNWSINPANYQYTMTVTATAKYSCVESIDPNNVIGAFINGVLAGFANVSTDVNGEMFAYITVYSNVSGGENITFKMYDASTDLLRDGIFTTTFQNNASVGTAVVPVVIKTDYDLDSLYIDTDIMFEFYQIGQEVCYFTLVNENMDEEVATYTFVNDSLGDDNIHFSINDSILVLEQDVDFLIKTTYEIHVLATTIFGCTFNQHLILTVLNSNSPPTDILISPTSFDENQGPDVFITQFVAEDISPNDSHLFEFVYDSINFPHNEFFTISTDSLISNINYDYESVNEYTLQIKVIDNLLNFYVDTFTVLINDLVEFTNFMENPIYFDENQDADLFISELTPLSLSVSYSLVYSVSADTNNFPDNMAFEVQTNELFSGKVYNYEEQDEYLIQIEVESDYGDLYYDTLTIFINDLIEFDDLKVTNFMTPNEDGANDYFVIPNPYLFEGYTLMIFNDNGNIVFTQEGDYENDWNGLTNEGVELPSATYYYTFIQKGQEDNNFKGKITILRSSKF
ncbi:MAG: gliding motility-associated-like protein [Planctomycetota bacterium]|jgi:gliding motility-associated-like protein